MFPANVESPEIFTLSNSVCPSKSMAPDISRLAAVRIPVAFIFVISTPVECKKLSPIPVSYTHLTLPTICSV